MKYRFIIYCLLLMIIHACAEDLGNYNYSKLPNIEVKGLEKSYRISQLSTLNIYPELNSFINVKHNMKEVVSIEAMNLSYEWIIDGRIVGKDRNLTYQIPTDMSFGMKEAIYRIIDNNTGLVNSTYFEINVASPFGDGFYFLTEDESKNSTLSYINTAIQKEKIDGDSELLKLSDLTCLSTNMVGDYPIGNSPLSICKSQLLFGSKTEGIGSNYYYSLFILTKEGVAPHIYTNTFNLVPRFLISSSSFIDKSGGYEFHPTECVESPDEQYCFFYISDGELIYSNKGMLYQPTNFNKKYDWSSPILSTTRSNCVCLFDKISAKYYVVRPQTNASGGFINKYRYNVVYPIVDFPEMANERILLTNNVKETILDYMTYQYTLKKENITIVTSSSEGIAVRKFSYEFDVDGTNDITNDSLLNLNYISTDNLPIKIDDINKVSAAKVKNSEYYFAINNKLYTSPVLLPKLKEVEVWHGNKKLNLNDYGTITSISLSGKETYLVVTFYDSSSAQEKKGSILIFNINDTSKSLVLKNIINKCVSSVCLDYNPRDEGPSIDAYMDAYYSENKE